MSTKVADLTLEELRKIIREMIVEVLEEEEEILTDEFAAELKARMESPDWVDAEEVWGKH